MNIPSMLFGLVYAAFFMFLGYKTGEKMGAMRASQHSAELVGDILKKLPKEQSELFMSIVRREATELKKQIDAEY